MFTAVAGKRIDVVGLSGGGVDADYGAEQKVAWGVVGLEDEVVVFLGMW